jgi:hypothetical protein
MAHPADRDTAADPYLNLSYLYYADAWERQRWAWRGSGQRGRWREASERQAEEGGTPSQASPAGQNGGQLQLMGTNQCALHL